MFNVLIWKSQNHVIKIKIVLVAMIDTLGGPQRVNNFLTTLDLPYISHKNLKVMERRAGHIIENFAEKSMANARKTAFEKEMRFDYFL